MIDFTRFSFILSALVLRKLIVYDMLKNIIISLFYNFQNIQFIGMDTLKFCLVYMYVCLCAFFFFGKVYNSSAKYVIYKGNIEKRYQGPMGQKL